MLRHQASAEQWLPVICYMVYEVQDRCAHCQSIVFGLVEVTPCHLCIHTVCKLVMSLLTLEALISLHFFVSSSAT